MFKNFIILAYRHFVRSPLTSFIELFGMTAGLTVFLLILLWVDHETSFDQFNEKADRIYRLEMDYKDKKLCLHSSIVSTLLKNNLPEVEKAVRLRVMGNGNTMAYTVDARGTKKRYNTGQQIFVDHGFFETFSFEFISGNPKTALADKNTVVITESLARTIFGKENAIGKIISEKFIVTGVVKDVPNFHIPFKMLRSFQSLSEHKSYMNLGPQLASWNGWIHPTYLLVNQNSKTSLLESKITKVLWTHYPYKREEDLSNSDISYHLRPLEDIYYNGGSVKENNYAIHGDRKKVAAYTTIAIFTLLLACVNFINLNSAKCLARAKEVGIKKVSGASSRNVFFQFLGEVFLICFVAMILALIFTHSSLPQFNELLNSRLSFEQLLKPVVLIVMVLGLILISMASGGLPALYMSSFLVVAAIKGLSKRRSGDFNRKKVSLIAQFVITIVLLVGSITTFRQVHFMKNADLALGNIKSTLITFSLWEAPKEQRETEKNVLLRHPAIEDISLVGAWSVPGTNRSTTLPSTTLKFKGIEHQLTRLGVDEDYMNTLDLELLEGRFFRGGVDEYDSVSRSYNILLNESAVKAIGLENPIGAIGKGNGINVKVIGVVKDFHINSVNNPIEPMFFNKGRYGAAIVKISSHNISSTIEFIETEVEKITGKKINVEILDQLYERQYNEENNFATLIGLFTTLAILIACLGLLGVATHAIKLRIKEIGIRKTMGASTLQILNLITLPFVKVIILSSVLAIPIAWIAMQSWLDNYPYRTDLPWWVFAVACGLTVAVAAFTIIWQSWRASSMNPARLIRYE
ncbi:MAG: ABC transporter permease [Cyclobacteriaceae bacterium]